MLFSLLEALCPLYKLPHLVKKEKEGIKSGFLPLTLAACPND
jgi:hypothetical protein